MRHRLGMKKEREARAVVQKFKEDSIPLDAIIFDLYWFGDTITGTMGNLEFHTDSFNLEPQYIYQLAIRNLRTNNKVTAETEETYRTTKEDELTEIRAKIRRR